MTQTNRSAHMQPPVQASKPDWWVVAPLIGLSLVPMLGGVVRVVGLAHPVATPENARFVHSPLPVIIHIIGSVLFSILGAFQFAPKFRQRNLKWHRASGRLVLVAGVASALSGVWMTHFYAIPAPLQGPVLYYFRYLIGAVMLLALGLSLAAILRKNISSHRNWMIRAYAIAQGAGTQALIFLPLTLPFGTLTGLPRDLLMCLGWIVNIAVAETIISRGRIPVERKRTSQVGD